MIRSFSALRETLSVVRTANENPFWRLREVNGNPSTDDADYWYIAGYSEGFVSGLQNWRNDWDKWKQFRELWELGNEDGAGDRGDYEN